MTTSGDVRSRCAPGKRRVCGHRDRSMALRHRANAAIHARRPGAAAVMPSRRTIVQVRYRLRQQLGDELSCGLGNPRQQPGVRGHVAPARRSTWVPQATQRVQASCLRNYPVLGVSAAIGPSRRKTTAWRQPSVAISTMASDSPFGPIHPSSARRRHHGHPIPSSAWLAGASADRARTADAGVRAADDEGESRPRGTR
jgi:hypothetical protein